MREKKNRLLVCSRILTYLLHFAFEFAGNVIYQLHPDILAVRRERYYFLVSFAVYRYSVSLGA
jgi:hypothetical protein